MCIRSFGRVQIVNITKLGGSVNVRPSAEPPCRFVRFGTAHTPTDSSYVVTYSCLFGALTRPQRIVILYVGTYSSLCNQLGTSCAHNISGTYSSNVGVEQSGGAVAPPSAASFCIRSPFQSYASSPIPRLLSRVILGAYC